MKKKRLAFKKSRFQKFFKKIRFFFHCFFYCIIICPFCYCGYFFYNNVYLSDLFLIKNIHISGLKKLKKQDIYRKLDGETKHIFSIDLLKILQKLKSDPYIKEAKLEKKLPHTLNIHIQEKKHFITLYYNNSYYYLDRYGSILEVKKSKEKDESTILLGLEYLKKMPILGQKLEHRKIRKAVEVLEIFLCSDNARFFDIKEIHMHNIKQIVLLTTKNLKIKIGSNEIEKKLKNLSIFLLKNKNLEEKSTYIDLRFGGVIVSPYRY